MKKKHGLLCAYMEINDRMKKKEGCDDAEYRSQRHSQTPVFNY